MHTSRCLAVFVVLLALPTLAFGGLYYSRELMAELPSQRRGFLLDQRALRQIAVRPAPAAPASPLRVRYLDEAKKLEQARQQRALTADELADLGAIYVRLGEPGKAVELLRGAQRLHPKHFAIAANLGTAWQAHGDLEQAFLALQQAVRLAPEKFQKAEEYHLKLVRLRLREKGKGDELDDLFGVRYVGEDGKYVPGKIAAGEKKKLPGHSVAVAQQLALWLPADPRLLWQLAELSNAYGDLRYAANMMDGCVTQFGLQHPELKLHRRLVRAAADQRMDKGDAAKMMHKDHVGGFVPRSKRPLLTKINPADLPPISATGINSVPWALLAETTLERKFRPKFPSYLRDLDGKQVTLNGFMQTLGEEFDVAVFMLVEYPVGCWYCDIPDATGIVFVELPEGKSTPFTRDLVRITGRLVLNSTDPEEFLYTIRNSRVSGVD